MALDLVHYAFKTDISVLHTAKKLRKNVAETAKTVKLEESYNLNLSMRKRLNNRTFG